MGLDLARVAGQRWLGGVMVAASLWLTGLPLMAQTSTSGPMVAASLQPYGYNDVFTIGLPANWQISQQSQAPQVTALAPAGDPAPMRTEITWHDLPPAEVVPPALEQIQTQGYQVVNYDAITINDTTALQIWLNNLPEDLPNALISYIGYPNQTAVIVTYYNNGQSTGAEDLISSIHQSFQRLP